MTTPQAPSPLKTSTPPWLHYSAWAITLAGPVLLLMPPRRVGFQAVVIATGTFAGVNVLVHDHTGTTLLGRWRDRFRGATTTTTDDDASAAVTHSDLPAKAQRTQALLRREREAREAALPEPERRALHEARARQERGLWHRLWYGDVSKEQWLAERERREKEALEEGKGYGGLIIDQVKEVFIGSSSRRPEEEGDGSRGEEKNKNNSNTDDKK